jgi:hypothetical protein
VKRLSPGWRDVFKTWKIDLALMRPTGSVAHELSREGGWIPWYCDSVAVLLRRDSTTQTGLSPSAADSAEHALDACSGSASRSGSAHNPDE